MSSESVNYDFWVAVGTIALAIVTGILAFFTWRVLDESKKARTEPIFVLEPTNYLSALNEPPGEKFTKLNLVNHGAPATDITATCMWLDNETGSGDSLTFYILSLARDGYAGLDIPSLHVEKIIKQKQFLKVKIDCKNAAGKSYSAIITNGLDKIRGTNTKIAYQGNNWETLYTAINNIYRTLSLKLK